MSRCAATRRGRKKVFGRADRCMLCTDRTSKSPNPVLSPYLGRKDRPWPVAFQAIRRRGQRAREQSRFEAAGRFPRNVRCPNVFFPPRDRKSGPARASAQCPRERAERRCAYWTNSSRSSLPNAKDAGGEAEYITLLSEEVSLGPGKKNKRKCVSNIFSHFRQKRKNLLP